MTMFPGKYDAFETALEILRVKALLPDALPFEYADLDKDFAAFMACGMDMIIPQDVDSIIPQGEAQEAHASDGAEALLSNRAILEGKADGEEGSGEVRESLSHSMDNGEGGGGSEDLQEQRQLHPGASMGPSEEADGGDQREAGGQRQGIHSPTSHTIPASNLCGISAFDTPGRSCVDRCGLGGRGKRASSQVSLSHGVPGGAMCCGHKAGLASCPRAWE